MNQQLQQVASAIDYANQRWAKFRESFPNSQTRLSKAECDRLRLMAKAMDQMAGEAETFVVLEESMKESRHGA